MANIGFVCPTATGHLNPMLSIGQELLDRGHSVFFYQLLDAQEKIENCGVIFRSFGTATFPKGRWNQVLAEAGALSGINLLNHSIKCLSTRNLCSVRETPELMKKDRIDLIVADEVGPEGRTLSDYLKIPYVTFSSALIMAEDSYVPPFFTPWKFKKSILGQMRNKVAYAFANYLRRDTIREMNKQRSSMGLDPLDSRKSTASKLLHISQLVGEFDFPRKHKLPALQYVGPLASTETRKETSFPFEKLTGRPLIYASLGSVMGSHTEIFNIIAAATTGIDADLVITTGGAAVPDAMKNLPGSPIVVVFAPQLELLKRASLCITHGGLNTVLEALSFGVPLIAIPLGNDQHGVASRISWSEVGTTIKQKKLNSKDLRQLIGQILSDRKFRENAVKMRKTLASAGGVKRAAALIESVI